MTDLGVTVALHSEFGVAFFASGTPVITAYDRIVKGTHRGNHELHVASNRSVTLREDRTSHAGAGGGDHGGEAKRDGADDKVDDAGTTAAVGAVLGEWTHLHALVRYYGHRSPVTELKAESTFLLSRSRHEVLMHHIKSGSLLWRHNCDEAQAIWMQIAPGVTHFENGPGVVAGLTSGAIVGCAGSLRKPLEFNVDHDLKHMATTSAYSKQRGLLLVGSNDFAVRALSGQPRGHVCGARPAGAAPEDPPAVLAWQTTAHADEVTCLVVDDELDRVFSGAAGREQCNCVIAYSLLTGKVLWKGVGHTRGVVVLTVVVAPGSRSGQSTHVVVSGSWDRTVRGWNASDGTQLWCGDAHSRAVTHLVADSIAVLGSVAVGASARADADERRSASPARAAAQPRTGTPADATATQTELTPTTSTGVLFSGSADKSVVCWSPLDGRVLWHQRDLDGWVSGLDVDGSARELIAACGAHGTTIMAYDDGRIVWAQDKSSEVIGAVTMCVVRRVYYSVHSDGGIRAWDLNAERRWAVPGKFSAVLVQAMPFEPRRAGNSGGEGESKAASGADSPGVPAAAGSRVFATTGNALVCLDADDGRQQWRSPGVDEPIVELAETPRAVVSLHDGSNDVHGTDKGTGDELWAVNCGTCPPRVIIGTPRSGLVFTGCGIGTVCGIDEAGIKFWEGAHGRGVNCLAFSESFGLLLSGSDDRVVRAWRGGKCLWETDEHAGSVSAVALFEAAHVSYCGTLGGAVVRRDGTGKLQARNSFRHAVRGLTVAGGPVGACSTIRGYCAPTGGLNAADATRALAETTLFVLLDFVVAACSADTLHVLYTIEPTMGSIMALHIDLEPVPVATTGICRRRRKLARVGASAGDGGSSAFPSRSSTATTPTVAAAASSIDGDGHWHRATFVHSWGSHGEYSTIDTKARTGITKATAEIVPARHRSAAERAIVRYDPWVDFFLMLSTHATDVVQLIAFVSVTSKWGDVTHALEPVLEFAGQSTPFLTVYVVTVIVAVGFLVMLSAAEVFELNMFLDGNTGPWASAWLLAGLVCRAASVSWLTPVMTAQLEGITCTGRASSLVGKENLDLWSLDAACYQGANVVVVILAALVIVWFMPAAYRLLRVRGDIDQVDVVRNPFDWSLDVPHNGIYVQVASIQTSSHLLANMWAKMLFVALSLFAPGGTGSVPSATIMLCASIAVAVTAVRSPPFFPTSRKLNAGVAGLDCLVVFLVALNLVEAVATDGGGADEGAENASESYKMVMAILLAAGPFVVAPLCGYVVYQSHHASTPEGAHQDELGVHGAAELLHPRDAKGNRAANHFMPSKRSLVDVFSADEAPRGRCSRSCVRRVVSCGDCGACGPGRCCRTCRCRCRCECRGRRIVVVRKRRASGPSAHVDVKPASSRAVRFVG